MLDWAERQGTPQRVIDPGSGSGRYLLAAGRRFPGARLIGVEIDPLAALIARGNLAAAGLAARAAIEFADFRVFEPACCAGRTLYLGNPPYVRHHLVSSPWKDWLKRDAAALGLEASGLAGLHLHFVLAIARRAAPGDFGAPITAAEWLDVNYGRLVRDLFVGPLGGEGIVVIEPTAACLPGRRDDGGDHHVRGRPRARLDPLLARPGRSGTGRPRPRWCRRRS
jgi:methylase of polypeptide subunit release factors